MATIINDATKGPDRKKDLYNHKSFNELYAYNDPISHLRGLSKKLFSRYIAQGLEAVKNRRPVTYADSAPIRVPLEELKVEEGEEAPEFLYFSTQQIIDPFLVSWNEKEREKVFQRLRGYIDLGVYPLVTQPLDEDRLYYAWQCYDALHQSREIVGTMVDAFQREGNIYATIMWHLQYSEEYPTELIAFSAGYLQLRDFVPTPDVWKGDGQDVINFGIPVYEYQHMRGNLEIINKVEHFDDYLNEALVTGNLTLDFVTQLLGNASQQAQSLVQAAASVKMFLEHGGEEKPAGVTVEPVEAPRELPDNLPPVPVEDASETDEFARRMNLMTDRDRSWGPGSEAPDYGDLYTSMRMAEEDVELD